MGSFYLCVCASQSVFSSVCLDIVWRAHSYLNGHQLFTYNIYVCECDFKSTRKQLDNSETSLQSLRQEPMNLFFSELRLIMYLYLDNSNIEKTF